MRAVLKPRRFFAILLIFVFLCTAASADGNSWLKRITTENAGAGADMTVSGSVTSKTAQPTLRMESYGIGLLIGDPRNRMSPGFTVSGTPNINITGNGDGFVFGAGVYSWGQSNTVTLNGGSIRATTTEGPDNRKWGGLTGLRLMTVPGGRLKVKSTADISINDPNNNTVRNIGVSLDPDTSDYPYKYVLDGSTVLLSADMDYEFLTSHLFSSCLITTADGQAPMEGFCWTVSLGSDVPLVFFDKEFNEIGSAVVSRTDYNNYDVGKLVLFPTVSFQRIPLTNLTVTLPGGSGTATWAKVEKDASVIGTLAAYVDSNGDHVVVMADKTSGYNWERKAYVKLVSNDDSADNTMDLELGGTISVESYEARGLGLVPSNNAEAIATLLPGAVISVKGTNTEGIYVSTTHDTDIPPTVKGGGNVTVVSESNAGHASGLWLLNSDTGISVALTGGGNKMTVRSTTNNVSDSDHKAEIASAFLSRPMGEDVTNTIRFEGDVEVRGGRENGVYSVPISGGIARTEILGDMTVTDSRGDGIYQAFNGDDIPEEIIGGVTDGKTAEVYLRGDINLVNARGGTGLYAANAVNMFGGVVVVDGDINVSGSGSLRGVYAESDREDSVVVVTGELNAPVPVRLPVNAYTGPAGPTPNKARVYLWKTDLDACQELADGIGFVLKIDEEQPALKNVTLSCDSAGNRFLDPITWEGRTYYGAFEGDVITVNGVPAGTEVLVKDAFGNPVEVTEKAGKYTFATPATGGALVTAVQTVTYSITKGDGATWTKGSKEGLNFTVKGSPDDTDTFANFTGIEIDGTAVDTANYTASKGSVELVLKGAYLEGLSEGKHSLTANFRDGTANGTFHIQAPPPKPLPKTGDDANPILWLGLMLIGTVLVIIAGKKKAPRRK